MLKRRSLPGTLDPSAAVSWGILGPDEALDAAVLAAAENRLLEPGAAQGVPDLDVAVCATDRESKRRDTAAGFGGGGVREGERIDRLRVIGDETAAVDIHDGGGCALRLYEGCVGRFAVDRAFFFPLSSC